MWLVSQGRNALWQARGSPFGKAQIGEAGARELEVSSTSLPLHNSVSRLAAVYAQSRSMLFVCACVFLCVTLFFLTFSMLCACMRVCVCALSLLCRWFLGGASEIS